MRLVLLSLILQVVSGFAPAILSSRAASCLEAASSGSSAEISRRAAMVVAAALAAGAPPAYALTISKTVEKLEKENMSEVNTKGAPEKHLPKISVDGGSVEVVVPHVMDPEKPHFIEYVWLKDEKTGKVLSAKAFQATDPSPPSLTASVKSGATVKAMLFCNLHGLWEGEAFTI